MTDESKLNITDWSLDDTLPPSEFTLTRCQQQPVAFQTPAASAFGSGTVVGLSAFDEFGVLTRSSIPMRTPQSSDKSKLTVTKEMSTATTSVKSAPSITRSQHDAERRHGSAKSRKKQCSPMSDSSLHSTISSISKSSPLKSPLVARTHVSLFESGQGDEWKSPERHSASDSSPIFQRTPLVALAQKRTLNASANGHSHSGAQSHGHSESRTHSSSQTDRSKLTATTAATSSSSALDRRSSATVTVPKRMPLTTTTHSDLTHVSLEDTTNCVSNLLAYVSLLKASASTERQNHCATRAQCETLSCQLAESRAHFKVLNARCVQLREALAKSDAKCADACQKHTRDLLEAGRWKDTAAKALKQVRALDTQLTEAKRKHSSTGFAPFGDYSHDSHSEKKGNADVLDLGVTRERSEISSGTGASGGGMQGGGIADGLAMIRETAVDEMKCAAKLQTAAGRCAPSLRPLAVSQSMAAPSARVSETTSVRQQQMLQMENESLSRRLAEMRMQMKEIVQRGNEQLTATMQLFKKSERKYKQMKKENLSLRKELDALREVCEALQERERRHYRYTAASSVSSSHSGGRPVASSVMSSSGSGGVRVSAGIGGMAQLHYGAIGRVAKRTHVKTPTDAGIYRIEGSIQKVDSGVSALRGLPSLPSATRVDKTEERKQSASTSPVVEPRKFLWQSARSQHT